MKKLIFAAALAASSAALSFTAHASNFLDTQYGPEGIEVHLLKASVANNVLTVAFMLDNTTGKSQHGITSMGVGNVAYTTTDKKFPVLKDLEGKFLASTITYDKKADGFIFVEEANDDQSFGLSKGAKTVGWVKFEAPADNEWPIEVSLPGVSPFTINNPAK